MTVRRFRPLKHLRLKQKKTIFIITRCSYAASINTASITPIIIISLLLLGLLLLAYFYYYCSHFSSTNYYNQYYNFQFSLVAYKAK